MDAVEQYRGFNAAKKELEDTLASIDDTIKASWLQEEARLKRLKWLETEFSRRVETFRKALRQYQNL